MKYRAAIFLALMISPSVCRGQQVLNTGLVELFQVSYTTTGPNPGWQVSIFDEDNSHEYLPAFISPLNRFVFDTSSGARFRIAGPQHLFTRPGNNLIWGFIGVDAGQLFRATPQNGTGAQLMLGTSLGEELMNTFVNSQLTITMSVVGITNPGQFSYYTNDNSSGSATGTFATPHFSTLTNLNTFNYSGPQNFFNAAFSAPGLYNVDFQFSGVLAAGNVPVTSDFYRYTFDVAAFAIPEPASWTLLGLGTVAGGVGAWYVRRHRQQAQSKVIHKRS